ncbi:DNA translocase FtsK 4TM domain-containing protein [Burkholderiaceae bacterium DAT-1]|nr:DNA translocase FtsK 4TM domain-containing protein [Burkholderiaceae bacterium DAT-1]
MQFFRRKGNQARVSRADSNPLPAPVAAILRESWWLAAVVAAIYLVIILASYSPGDPGWSHVSPQTLIRNKGGAFGAWCADVLLSVFGYSAWWLVAFCMSAIWWGYRRLEKVNEDQRLVIVAVVGFMMILLSSSSLEALRLHSLTWPLPDAPGGIIGLALGGLLFHALGFIGATLALLASFSIGMSLFVGVSWLGMMEKLGTWVETRVLSVFERVEAFQDRRAGERAATARADKVKVERQRFEDAPAIVIQDPLPEQPPEESPREIRAREKAAAQAAQASLFEEAALPPWEEPGEPDLPAAPAALDLPEIDTFESDVAPIREPVPAVPVAPVAAPAIPHKTVVKKTPPLIKHGRPELPDITLLAPPPPSQELVSHETIEYTSRLIERKLAEFGVEVKVVAAYPGPVITRYEIEPATGVKGSQIVNLMKDLARALSLISIRVVETIPGKTYMGLELPNPKRQIVRLSEIIGSQPYHDSSSLLTMAFGKDISGKPVVSDLAKAPHMLVAGTTGSGKSVAMNAIILSMLYKATADEVRLIMIDPKMLELSIYEGIPHLLAPVVTDMKHAANALNWCVGEMEKRYRLMSAMGVRNLAGFNQKLKEAEKRGERLTNPFSLTPENPEPLAHLPMIVVLIDELADLMMVAGKKIEELIARLAQKARAAGIHLILATQRPSVDVITGLIKANIPTRMAFQVSSKIDSRTILDQMGAESLLGQGDGLFLPPGSGYPQRIHGAFVADEEVHAVVEFLKQQGEPNYIEGILTGAVEGEGGGSGEFGLSGGEGEGDAMYDEAVAFVIKSRKASISSVQRQLRIGYNRAARLVEQMEAAGLVSPPEHNGNRTVLVPAREEA